MYYIFYILYIYIYISSTLYVSNTVPSHLHKVLM